MIVIVHILYSNLERCLLNNFNKLICYDVVVCIKIKLLKYLLKNFYY